MLLLMSRFNFRISRPFVSARIRSSKISEESKKRCPICTPFQRDHFPFHFRWGRRRGILERHPSRNRHLPGSRHGGGLETIRGSLKWQITILLAQF